MPSDSDYAGRWFGLCQNNEPESFLELVITRDEEGKWTLCMRDRHYERAPESTIFERSFWGLANTDLHNISSCTKSITSILAGIAIDQGLFSLDNKVVKFFPWITNTRWGEEPPVLVRHVLSMTSGTVDTPSRSAEMLVSSDIEEFVLSAERDCHPGTRYQYNNSLPSLRGSIIERTSGMSLEQFANLYLFSPLGIKAYEWSKMKMSTSKGRHQLHTLATLECTIY